MNNEETMLTPSGKRKLRIMFISEFYYPGLGGVEMHKFQLQQCLMNLGHKVIEVTISYGKRQGVRYMSNGLKVYYVPFQPILDKVACATVFPPCPIFRMIMIREQIDIVHIHQATTTMGKEIHLLAKAMGRKVMYTDHSLFGFDDMACFNLNKGMKCVHTDLDAAIAVSHTCRENLVLRTALDPRIIYTIPNAVDHKKFTPDPSMRFPLNTINIVVMSRLTYRKGIDLLIDVIPGICARFPEVYFIIGGDGPKRYLLEEMKDKYRLHNRMELLGIVPHEMVKNVLVRGHIFLNTSLTESFCIAIVEAASCGLLVVATDVGGVSEVMPQEMIYLSPVNPQGLIDALARAIPHANNIPSYKFSQKEKVYHRVMKHKNPPLLDKIRHALGTGPWMGLLFVLFFASYYFYERLLEFLVPEKNIDIAPEFPYKLYMENKHKIDHSFPFPIPKT